MLEVVLIIHFIVALLLIVLILLQQGKGATAGAAFGSGASSTIFGSRGPASFLMKLTGCVVVVFFITSLTLAALAARSAHSSLEFPVNKSSGSSIVPVSPPSSKDGFVTEVHQKSTEKKH